METPDRVDSTPRLKLVYWIAAAAMTISIVLDVMKTPNWLSVGGRVSLVIAMVILATAKPVETRAKKIVVYALCAISLGLLLAKIAGGGS